MSTNRALSLLVSYYTLPLLIPIILLESILLWVLAKKYLGGINFWKVLLIVFVSNVASSLIGTLIPLYKNRVQNLLWIGTAFVLSVILEWIIYLLFLRRRTAALLGISAIVNSASYVMIVAVS